MTTLIQGLGGYAYPPPKTSVQVVGIIFNSKSTMKKIVKVAELISIVRTAKAGGQFATITGEHTTKFNQFPNENYCKAKGITLASGKGSKALNEPFRFNGLPYTDRFKVEFHWGQDYDRTLAKAGGERSEQGANKPIDHFGGIAIGYPTTKNVCLVYMDGDYTWYGYYLNGEKVTDAETLAYIAGYKSASKPQLVEYRTLGYRNIRTVTVGKETYEVCLSEITESEYDALCVAFGAERSNPKPNNPTEQDYPKVG